jgi:hypothetical protein
MMPPPPPPPQAALSDKMFQFGVKLTVLVVATIVTVLLLNYHVAALHR